MTDKRTTISIPLAVLEDPNLSLACKGLFAYVLSRAPLAATSTDLAMRFGKSKTTFLHLLRELCERGYLRMECQERRGNRKTFLFWVERRWLS